jgi:hypothetical protein
MFGSHCCTCFPEGRGSSASYPFNEKRLLEPQGKSVELISLGLRARLIPGDSGTRKYS